MREIYPGADIEEIFRCFVKTYNRAYTQKLFTVVNQGTLTEGEGSVRLTSSLR
jgi:hypothetical protein